MTAKKKKPLLNFNYKFTKPKIKNKQKNKKETDQSNRKSKFLRVVEKRENEFNNPKFTEVDYSDESDSILSDSFDQSVELPRLFGTIYKVKPITSVVLNINEKKTVKWYVRLWRNIRYY